MSSQFETMPEVTEGKQVNALFGNLFLICGVVLSCLIFADRWTELNIRFPSFWYRARGLHLVSCVGFYVAAWLALRNTSVSEPPENATAPLFDSLNFYTRADCCLCDDALKTLDEFSQHLPEIQMIDIDVDQTRQQEFTDCVPVVEIDGRVVFRGRVNRELLNRLITAKQNQAFSQLAFEAPTEYDV